MNNETNETKETKEIRERKEKKIYYALLQIPFTAFFLQMILIILFNCWNYIVGFLMVSAFTVLYIYILDKNTKNIKDKEHNNSSNSNHEKD